MGRKGTTSIGGLQMRRVGKPVFFIVLLLIVAVVALSFAGISTQYGDIKTTYIKGANDIRWGIDIRGGVDATFSPGDGYQATRTEMEAAEAVIKERLVSKNITDYEVYTDYDKNRIIVRFPWKEGETDFNPEQAIKELGETARLTFREGMEYDQATGAPSGITAETIILEGRDVARASVGTTQQSSTSAQEVVVQLELNSEGAVKFEEATRRLAGSGVISIWMDEIMISYPTVQSVITGGLASISGGFDVKTAKSLADKINAGALPFKLEVDNYNSISPTLGENAKDAMVLAGLIAFAVIALFMVGFYRLPGLIAMIGLAGQVALIIASITGFFAPFSSFTLTLPGIAGIILSIGTGVDANVITSERIKEELRAGKTLDGAINSGCKRAFTAILDGNITIIIVAVILMGAFGPPRTFFGTLLRPFFFMFGPSTAGTIYSFGYTLLMGVIFNFIMSIYCTRMMIKSISGFPALRNKWLYGGEKA